MIWYIAEVNIGGHNQFYFNSTGIVWKDALAGLKELGMDEAVEIVQELAARMGGNSSLDQATRKEQLDTYQSSFDDLGTRFYEEESVDIYKDMRQYILQHRSAFYFEGKVQKLKPRPKYLKLRKMEPPNTASIPPATLAPPGADAQAVSPPIDNTVLILQFTSKGKSYDEHKDFSQ